MEIFQTTRDEFKETHKKITDKSDCGRGRDKERTREPKEEERNRKGEETRGEKTRSEEWRSEEG